MNSNILVSLVVVLLPFSLITEHFSNLSTLVLPSNGRLRFGNLLHKENDSEETRKVGYVKL